MILLSEEDLMAYISKPEAEIVLAPIIPSLRSCILDAWDQSLNLPLRHTFESRTKSGIVRDLIVAKIKERFDSSQWATPIQTKHHFFLKAGHLLIRFKKLNLNRLPQNYPTKQAVALEAQELELPGMSNTVYLNAGYSTDMTATRITSVFLTCQRNKSNDWELSLGGTEHGLIVLPVQQSFDDVQIIRPKKELVRKEVNGESAQG